MNSRSIRIWSTVVALAIALNAVILDLTPGRRYALCISIGFLLYPLASLFVLAFEIAEDP